MPPVVRDQLATTLAWFNRHLPVPRLDDSEWRSLFWFRSESQPLIRRMWELVHWLEGEGLWVIKRHTRQPGQIVYRDDYQVAAIPPGAKRRTA